MSAESLIEKVVHESCQKVLGKLEPDLVLALQQELDLRLRQILFREELYKYASEEMQRGIYSIFKEISEATHGVSALTAEKNELNQKIFVDTKQQLDEIMETVLSATESIMDSTEELLDKQEEAACLLADLEKNDTDSESLTRLSCIVSDSNNLLSSIMTSLSFQDLTGQRLKKVTSSIEKIRENVFDLYLSTGLLLKYKDSESGKDLEEIKAENKEKLAKIKKEGSELKGPVLGSKQSDVDDLLADLGL